MYQCNSPENLSRYKQQIQQLLFAKEQAKPQKGLHMHPWSQGLHRGNLLAIPEAPEGCNSQLRLLRDGPLDARSWNPSWSIPSSSLILNSNYQRFGFDLSKPFHTMAHRWNRATCKVSGIMDKPKGDFNGGSNHDHVLEAFQDAGYIVVHKLVDPGDARLPVTRGRVHYIGVHRDALNGTFYPWLLKDVWREVSDAARTHCLQHPLDDFLWGSHEDPALADHPSAKAMLGPDLEKPIEKKRKIDPAWPKLHQKILESNGVPGLHMGTPPQALIHDSFFMVQ